MICQQKHEVKLVILDMVDVRPRDYLGFIKLIFVIVVLPGQSKLL